MATSSALSDAELAKLLNLNSTDSDAFKEVLNDYFGQREDEESDSSSDDGDIEEGKRSFIITIDPMNHFSFHMFVEPYLRLEIDTRFRFS